MKFVRKDIVIYLVVFFGLEWLRCPFVTSFKLLGMNGYGQTKVRTVIEMYKIYDRSFNFIKRKKFYTADRNKIDVKSPQWFDEIENKMIKSDGKLATAINNEFSHVCKQANYGTSLTDLLTTLFVQYMSLSYAYEFNRGFLHFRKENDVEKSSTCLNLAYYLAWFGSESRTTVKSIAKILKIKCPVANEKFLEMNESLKILQNKIKTTKVQKMEEEIFSNEKFQKEMNLVTTYFRETVLGEPNIFEDEYLDLDEYIKLWATAKKFSNHLSASYDTQYYNADSGRKKESSSQEETANFLGMTRFESDDIRAEMIVLNNYQKGYHYANQMKFHTRFEFYEHWFAFSRYDFHESDKMGFELKYVFWQSISATCLTELFSILFVQYMSAVYAFRLACGFDHFQERGDEDNAAYNANTSYYLAWFATKDDVILAAIERNLRLKYSQKSNLFAPVATAMRRISAVVRRQISRKYTSAENKLELFDPDQLETKQLMRDVQTTNTFFRRLLTGKTNVTAENVVDLKGGKKLWYYARKLYSLVIIQPDEKYENPITGRNDMNLSTVSSIIQLAELLSVQNKYSNDVYLSDAGQIDEFFITKLVRDEYGEERFRFEEISTGNLFPQINE